MSEEMKKCPFCGGEIRIEAIKCKHCGKFLNESKQEITFTIPQLVEMARFTGLVLASIGIAVFLIWLLFFDYPSYLREENWEQIPYIVSSLIHILLAILCGIIVLALKK